MNCPICGANMTEFEKKTFNNRCSDCYSDVWATENIGEKQSIEQVENMIKIFKSMKRKEADKYIKASYDYAIKSYEKPGSLLKIAGLPHSCAIQYITDHLSTRL